MKITPIVVLLLSVGAGAQAQTWLEFYGEKSSHLDTGMTLDQVKTIVGLAPTKVSLSTCGGVNGIKPWQCKIADFDSVDTGPELEVIFYQASDGTWLVNGWDVFKGY